MNPLVMPALVAVFAIFVAAVPILALACILLGRPLPEKDR